MLLPCKSPKADPGLAIPSPAANFLKLVSLELGRGLDADEKAPPPRPVNPSKLDCLVLAKALRKEFFRCCNVMFVAKGHFEVCPPLVLPQPLSAAALHMASTVCAALLIKCSF